MRWIAGARHSEARYRRDPGREGAHPYPASERSDPHAPGRRERPSRPGAPRPREARDDVPLSRRHRARETAGRGHALCADVRAGSGPFLGGSEVERSRIRFTPAARPGGAWDWTASTRGRILPKARPWSRRVNPTYGILASATTSTTSLRKERETCPTP